MEQQQQQQRVDENGGCLLCDHDVGATLLCNAFSSSSSNENEQPQAEESRSVDNGRTETTSSSNNNKNKSKEESRASKKTRSTVAVIGCGPGGMFFLHAAAMKREAFEKEGNEEGLASLPVITCFERSDEPGGVWRAHRQHTHNGDGATAGVAADARDGEEKKETSSEEDSKNKAVNDGGVASAKSEAVTNMYEALWTNGCKEAHEFFDYTFDDHFGCSLPVYMPRQPLLEYMIYRVTRNNPTIFQDHVRFRTTVKSVTYDHQIRKFSILSLDHRTGQQITEQFDKCIWGAGDNGRPYIPKSLQTFFTDGGYRGSLIHSSQVGTVDFKHHVQGKRILILGDSYSAEDLALQAIRLGVERIYIYSKNGSGTASYVAAWPKDKVQILWDFSPTQIIDNGHGIRFQANEYNYEKWDYDLVPEGEIQDITDISTVIYCTGYWANVYMLHPSLRPPYYDYDTMKYNYDHAFYDLPSDWKMKPNPLTNDLGDVTPYTYIAPWYGSALPGLYRGFLMSNPNMMFIQGHSDTPLFEIDIKCWMFLNAILGNATSLPSTEEEMKRDNNCQIIADMDVSYIRSKIDANYWRATEEILPSHHWYNDYSDDKFRPMDAEYLSHQLRKLTRDMHDGDYPVQFHVNAKDHTSDWNDMGKQFLCNMKRDYTARLYSHKKTKDWYTFRDEDPSKYVSIFTGTKAVALKQKWIEMDDEEYKFLEQMDKK